MTSNMTITIEQYRSRRQRLLADLDEIKADLKELDLEAKVSGFNVAELRKWVDAEHKDKPGKRVADVVDAVLYGEALGHDLGMVPKSDLRKDESPSKEPPHDPETGEIAPPVSQRTRAAAQRFVDSVAKNPGDSVSIEAGGRRTTISNVEGRKEITSEAVAEPAPSKPHILTPSERDPLWEFEHRGMIDAASGQHRVPTDLAGEQLAAWQKGHDEKMAAIRGRAA